MKINLEWQPKKNGNDRKSGTDKRKTTKPANDITQDCRQKLKFKRRRK